MFNNESATAESVYSRLQDKKKSRLGTGIFSNSSDGCVLNLGNNSQHIVHENTTLYCGFNGEIWTSVARITWISPSGDELGRADGLRGKPCSQTRLGLNTSSAAEGIYTCTVEFTDAVHHLLIGVYHSEGKSACS